MDAATIRQNHVSPRITTWGRRIRTVQKYVIGMRRTDSECSWYAVALAVCSAQDYRNHVGFNQIGLVVDEKPSSQVYWISIIGIAGLRADCGSEASRYHRSGEFVDLDSSAWNYLCLIRAHRALAVHEPTLLVCIVVPEVENASCRMMKTVWIEESGATWSVWVIHLDVCSAGLNREIEGHRNSGGERKWRLVERNGRDANLVHNFPIAVENGGLWR